MKDLKYILAFISPLIAYVNVIVAGPWSFATAIFLFGLLPFIELFSKGTTENLTPEAEMKEGKRRFYDFLLYLNLPLLIGIIIIYLNRVDSGLLVTYELVGLTLCVGMMIGTIGINIAHELGHRTGGFDLFVAKSLLMTAFYIHFNIEHNRGHHKFVSTPEDPSSARYKEPIYAFWIRSIFGVYAKAWSLEHQRLRKLKYPLLSAHNEMIRIHLIQAAYVLVISLVWSWQVVLFAFLAGILGVLLLESVNYIEHYGLTRKKKPSGRYEAVGPHHSWNSNNDMGRIFLFELTRHSDHHFRASRKYQILRHFDESPQLPTGYPGSILVALVPPLWFALMNDRVIEFNKLDIAY